MAPVTYISAVFSVTLCLPFTLESLQFILGFLLYNADGINSMMNNVYN